MRTRFAVQVWTPRHLIACGVMGEPVPPVIQIALSLNIASMGP